MMSGGRDTYLHIQLCLLVLSVIVEGTLAASLRPAMHPGIEPGSPGGRRYPTFAGEDFAARPSRLTDNLRWALDLSSQIDASTDRGESAFQNIIGLDAHKVFSGERGDWGTLTFQLYMTRFDNQNPHPPFVEDDDDWELVPRILNFNYTGLGHGRFNIRLGHFEIPYGLEVPINTNGTLRQVMTGPNLGVVVDWGAGINGAFSFFDYEVSLTRGSGIEYSDQGNPYVLAGRIGIPTGPASVGFSGFYGQVASGASGITTRSRFGTDLQMQRGPLGFLGEVSVGEDERQEVINTYLETNWSTPNEIWMLYLGGLTFTKRVASGWDEAFTLNAGLQFSCGASWYFSLQHQQELITFGSKDRDGILSAQVRYRH